MPITEIVLWAALLAAFSPAIAEFGRGFSAGFSPWSTLLAPVLIGVCVLRGAATLRQPDRRGGWLVAAGGLLQVAGIYLETWTIAWLGLPIALVGMALFVGRPLPVAMLAFGLVPVPVSLVILYSPTPETVLLSGACAAWRALGLDIACIGPVASIGSRSLELISHDVGLPLAAVLAELGWFVAVNEGAPWPHALRKAVLFASATIVVLPLAIWVAVGMLAAGAEDLAKVWLRQGVWLTCAIATLAWSLRTTAYGPASRQGVA